MQGSNRRCASQAALLVLALLIGLGATACGRSPASPPPPTTPPAQSVSIPGSTPATPTEAGSPTPTAGPRTTTAATAAASGAPAQAAGDTDRPQLARVALTVPTIT